MSTSNYEDYKSAWGFSYEEQTNPRWQLTYGGAEAICGKMSPLGKVIQYGTK